MICQGRPRLASFCLHYAERSPRPPYRVIESYVARWFKDESERAPKVRGMTSDVGLVVAGAVGATPQTPRSASLGDSRAAPVRGNKPASAPIDSAAPKPPAHAEEGMTTAQPLLEA